MLPGCEEASVFCLKSIPKPEASDVRVMDLIADDQTRTSHGQTSQSCGRGFKHPLEAIQSIDKACFLLRDFKSTKPFLTVHATELIDASCSRNTVLRCELSSSSPGESTRRNETGKEPEAAQGAEAEKT